MSREKFILFSGQLIPRVIDGSKTMTRRLITPQWMADYLEEDPSRPGVFIECCNVYPELIRRTSACPYGGPGTRLVVKEAAWMFCERVPNGETKLGRQKWRYAPLEEAPLFYCADHPERPTLKVEHPETGNKWGWRYKPGRFLPRWASRLTLEVTDVRAERLHDMKRCDPFLEGCPTEVAGPDGDIEAAHLWFRELWERINGPGSWGANPWVWVVEFERL